ncbi:hypothetical protein PAPYR_3142 [Paratrimastix pyriformis]|uniref:DUF4380 domain-containing protein n=1 Tax=Paratrimastix pyriformis TaxID=342808 RepID=A0ABQ8UMW6_9EUKA|nr:hypothetical protein PAPYR_3142 [Paratrimastix pyriformis]
MQFQEVDFAGLHCVRLSNGIIELIASVQVGPRILRLGFVGDETNLMHLESPTLTAQQDGKWHPYGGHRLWHAPEEFPRTYFPDNHPVEHTFDGTTLVLRPPPEPENGVQKEIRITMHPGAAQVDVLHHITNISRWPIPLAPWSLTVCRAGGACIIPQEPYKPHPEALLPVRPQAMWAYTNMQDPRWTWGEHFIVMRQDRSPAKYQQKIGFGNTLVRPLRGWQWPPALLRGCHWAGSLLLHVYDACVVGGVGQGWAAYALDSVVFIKRFAHRAGATYPDYGCNCEFYTDPHILEVETLGPLGPVQPQQTVAHTEHWSLHRQAAGAPLSRMLAMPAEGRPAPVDEAQVQALLAPMLAETRPVA